jgi:hypothetical protein
MNNKFIKITAASLFVLTSSFANARLIVASNETDWELCTFNPWGGNAGTWTNFSPQGD